MIIQTDDTFSEGDIYKLFNNNHLAKSLAKKMSTHKDSILFFRFFRTGLVGQALYQESFEKMFKLDRIRLESIGYLCELYVFYLRSIYDHLLSFLEKNTEGDLPRSFNKFIKKIELGDFPEISEKFKKRIIETQFSFEELRNLRDSIKEKSSAIFPYINENGDIRISAKVYGRDKKDRQTIDEELSIFIYKQAFSIWYLMTMIYMEVNNKDWDTLEELENV